MADVFTRNTISGQVGYVPEDYLDHPVLGKTLERVPEGTKSYLPEMHQERTAEDPNTDAEGRVETKTDNEDESFQDDEDDA